MVYGFADELNPIDLPVLERVLADQDISGGGSSPVALGNNAQTLPTTKIPVNGNGRIEKLETDLRELRADIFKRLVALENNRAAPRRRSRIWKNC